MMLKIERKTVKSGSRIRLCGDLRSEHLEELRGEIELSGPQVTLDLDEVCLVDSHAVRFLNACEVQGVEVVNCARYIREWMYQERARE